MYSIHVYTFCHSKNPAPIHLHVLIAFGMGLLPQSSFGIRILQVSYYDRFNGGVSQILLYVTQLLSGFLLDWEMYTKFYDVVHYQKLLWQSEPTQHNFFCLPNSYKGGTIDIKTCKLVRFLKNPAHIFSEICPMCLAGLHEETTQDIASITAWNHCQAEAASIIMTSFIFISQDLSHH